MTKSRDIADSINRIDSSAADATAMTIDANENVGIGTSSPTSLGTGITTLDLKGNSSSQTDRSGGIRFTRQDGTHGMSIYNADGASYIESRSTYPLLITTNNSEAMRINSSGNVGIGETSPSSYYSKDLVVKCGSSEGGITIRSNATTDTNYLMFADGTSGTARYRGYLGFTHNSPENMQVVTYGYIRFYTGDPTGERMRIDSSGRVFIGNANNDVNPASTGNAANKGVTFGGASDPYLSIGRTGNAAIVAGRIDSDGEIILLYGDGTIVGSIGTFGGDIQIGTGNNNLYFNDGATSMEPRNADGTRRDNAIDMGHSNARFDDIYATNGTIQTSDQNEKQQIASLTSAEITAAKAISKLFKTFKWNDKVTAKGDAARTHAGVIAQEVQSAMTDAGLNAADYAFWCSDTWWETQTEVPAVEAVDAVTETQTNEEGDEVQVVVKEAVEAQDAYTRTDTYDTADEAPEGATERTRLGIRYPELLAFVGAATEQRLADIETRLTTLENA